MAFFTFDQNNSGGSFVHDPKAGIGYNVCIEANDADHANARAEEIGLYFDGCSSDLDCPCCGDRWYKAWENDGTESPALYGGGDWGIRSYIHYLNGRVVEVTT